MFKRETECVCGREYSEHNRGKTSCLFTPKLGSLGALCKCGHLWDNHLGSSMRCPNREKVQYYEYVRHVTLEERCHSCSDEYQNHDDRTCIYKGSLGAPATTLKRPTPIHRVEVGERIKIYIQGDNISECIQSNTMEATIIGVNKDDGSEYVLGWKANEPRPPYSYERTRCSEYDYSPQADLFEYQYVVRSSTLILLIEPETTKVKDLSDWRLWAHNVPGECACGIPVAMCTYHR